MLAEGWTFQRSYWINLFFLNVKSPENHTFPWEKKVCLWKWSLPTFVIIPSWKSNLEPLQTHIFPFQTTEGEKREAATTQEANITHGLSSSSWHQKCAFSWVRRIISSLFREALEHSWWDGLCSQPAVVGSGAGLSHGRAWDLVGQHLQPGACMIWGALSTVWSQPCL